MIDGLGSSPHTRGALDDGDGAREDHRIIPAYAGSTPSPPEPPWRWPDHPRIRGEHPARWPPRRRPGGSSPHTRGAPIPMDPMMVWNGIIPAYAGSTTVYLEQAHYAADHPRIRGEHVIKIGADLSAQGSSPHTRGAPVPRLHRDVAERIIPAYAGSTSAAPEAMCRMRDHPRIRGEHAGGDADSVPDTGSSPHTRGAPLPPAGACNGGRIIPAYAGSTRQDPPRPPDCPDHPRIRGEHADGVLTRMSVGGSSPHTRGARRPGRYRRAGRWIIPAYAGSTWLGPARRAGLGDHPRIRGEHRGLLLAGADREGSSPHTRGAHQDFCDGRHEEGIIPAYAGSTMHLYPPVHRFDGSSPHTRGAHAPPGWRRGFRGIIPAYAGSTGLGPCGLLAAGDHPRIRGEHRREEECRGQPGRIIPAYAGSTSIYQLRQTSKPDHPRIRGEHRSVAPPQHTRGGSSPHTRGARPAWQARHRRMRIIPAYAGSTPGH